MLKKQYVKYNVSYSRMCDLILYQSYITELYNYSAQRFKYSLHVMTKEIVK